MAETEVIAIRISKELKGQLKESDIDYAEEIRKHLQLMMNSDKLKKTMKDVNDFRRKLGKKARITSSSADIIREDREHAH